MDIRATARQVRAREEGRRQAEIVMNAIKEKMAPFKPTRITLWYTDRDRYFAEIECRDTVLFRLECEYDDMSNLAVSDPELAIHTLADRFANCYVKEYRALDYELPSTISLGEN